MQLPPAKPGKLLHLACNYPRSENPFGARAKQSTPDQITRVGMDVCSTYSPNALVIWNIFDECTS